MEACTNCGQTAREANVKALLVCARCKGVAYCSADCQKKHWKKEHKKQRGQSTTGSRDQCFELPNLPMPEISPPDSYISPSVAIMGDIGDLQANRSMVANRDILPGEVVLVSRLVVYVLDDESTALRCNACYKICDEKAMSCKNCRRFRLCSDCEAAKKPICKLHAAECKKYMTIDPQERGGIMQRFCARFFAMVEEGLLDPSVFDSLCTNEHLEPPVMKQDCEQAIDDLLKHLTLPSGMSRKAMMAFASRIRYNAFNMPTFSRSGGRQGKALALQPSFLNHSCNPNCMYEDSTSYDNYMVVRATRNIIAGEHLSISYLSAEKLAALGAQQRQKELGTNYLFMCQCQMCLDQGGFRQRTKT
eukprot:TRINITY_DN46705_c0_g1_i1.p1 TRINITY_DN46705_c0_g1~~TRINITY_DN46705_c0_g1_i1.p1  ORF type:complete len:361 (+),score=52.96 TRINITY_DN46705_c0_g1_i1:47-1129(+)